MLLERIGIKGTRTAITILTLGTAIAFGASTPANAMAILNLSDNLGNSVSIMDTDNDGVVTYFGSLGGTTVWTVNVTTGITKPLIGSANLPKMDLNSVNVSSSSGGTLNIEFIDFDFALPVGGSGILSAGGTTNGTVSFGLSTDLANGTNFTSLASIGPLGGGAFSASQSIGFASDDAFSLALLGSITHLGGGQVSSFDLQVEVPEPGTLAILGIGLVGLGFAQRRQKKRAAA